MNDAELQWSYSRCGTLKWCFRLVTLMLVLILLVSYVLMPDVAVMRFALLHWYWIGLLIVSFECAEIADRRHDRLDSEIRSRELSHWMS